MTADNVPTTKPQFVPPAVPTGRLYCCVKCNKKRLTKYDTYDENGNILVWQPTAKTLKIGDNEHPDWENLCHTCSVRIYKKYYTSPKLDVNKLIKALEGNVDLGDKSLEELL